MGHNTPAELEINHTHSHYGSFEDMLNSILDNDQPETITITPDSQDLDRLPEHSTVSDLDEDEDE